MMAGIALVASVRGPISNGSERQVLPVWFTSRQCLPGFRIVEKSAR